VSDFLESAKQKVGQAINRASWETEKRLRINSKQSEVNNLKQEREQVIESLASAVLLLHRQGRMNDPQLRQYCERLVEMERETMLANAQLEQIRAETYQGFQEAKMGAMGMPGSPSQVPPVSPAPSKKRGAAAAAAEEESQAGMVPCPTCGEPVRSKALYCNKCGTKLH
jgi:hypothetical protein